MCENIEHEDSACNHKESTSDFNYLVKRARQRVTK